MLGTTGEPLTTQRKDRFMATCDLNPEQLRHLLDYDPESGIFRWKNPIGRKAVAGMVAGSIDKDGYVSLSVLGRKVRAHRAAWAYITGVSPSGDIDHRNGVRSDNRWSNLREVSRSVNMQNQRKARSSSTSGFLGVEFHRASGLWLARIKSDGKRVNLGYHKTPEAAHAAYLAAKRKLHEGCTI